MKRPTTQQADSDQRQHYSDLDQHISNALYEDGKRTYIDPGSTATRAMKKLQTRATTGVPAPRRAGIPVESKVTLRWRWNSMLSPIRWNLGFTYIVGSIIVILLLASQFSHERPPVAAFNETADSTAGSSTAVGTLPANEYVQNQMVSVTYALR